MLPIANTGNSKRASDNENSRKRDLTAASPEFLTANMMSNNMKKNACYCFD